MQIIFIKNSGAASERSYKHKRGIKARLDKKHKIKKNSAQRDNSNIRIVLKNIKILINSNFSNFN